MALQTDIYWATQLNAKYYRHISYLKALLSFLMNNYEKK